MQIGEVDVLRFERGTDTLIIKWIIKIETYLITNLIKRRSWVSLIIGRINGKQFDDIKLLLRLDYCALRGRASLYLPRAEHRLVVTAEIGRVAHGQKETISANINRLTLLAVQAYLNLKQEQRETIFVAVFICGLADKGLASYSATINPKILAKAEQLALAGSAMRLKFKTRKSTGTYFGANTTTVNTSTVQINSAFINRNW